MIPWITLLLWCMVITSFVLSIISMVKQQTNTTDRVAGFVSASEGDKRSLGSETIIFPSSDLWDDSVRSGDRMVIPSNHIIEVDTVHNEETCPQLLFVEGRVHIPQHVHKGYVYLHAEVGTIKDTHVICPQLPVTTEFYFCLPTTPDQSTITLSFDSEFEIDDLTLDFVRTARFSPK